MARSNTMGKEYALKKFRVRWSVEGTTMVDAKDEDEAEVKFDKMEANEYVANGLVSVDIYDIDEIEPEKEG